MKRDTHLSDPLLLQIIDSGYNRKAWHGPNLRQSLRGVSAEDAAWRPAPGRHNIWEIAVHAAYWKYVVRRRLRGDLRGSFACEGSNWFVRPSPTAHNKERRGSRTSYFWNRNTRSCVRPFLNGHRSEATEYHRLTSTAWRSTTFTTPARSAYSGDCDQVP